MTELRSQNVFLGEIYVFNQLCRYVSLFFTGSRFAKTLLDNQNGRSYCIIEDSNNVDFGH